MLNNRKLWWLVGLGVTLVILTIAGGWLGWQNYTQEPRALSLAPRYQIETSTSEIDQVWQEIRQAGSLEQKKLVVTVQPKMKRTGHGVTSGDTEPFIWAEADVLGDTIWVKLYPDPERFPKIEIGERNTLTSYLVASELIRKLDISREEARAILQEVNDYSKSQSYPVYWDK